MVRKRCKRLETSGHRRIPTKNSEKTILDLSSDELLFIFSFLDLKNQFIVRRVCIHWKVLIGYVFSAKKSLSFVNDTSRLLDWKYELWSEVVPTPKHFTKMRFNSFYSSLSNILSLFPNIRDLDVECYDFDTKAIKTIVEKCPHLERINFDSSNGFNARFANYFTDRLIQLRVVNLSCVSQISEKFVAKLLQSTHLVALNVCGTDITGECLSLLGPQMLSLNLSYCWNLEGPGLKALTRSQCSQLTELSVNNFNFDDQTANECLSAICAKFTQLKRLDMSLGPCTQPEFYLNTLNFNGLSSIGTIRGLQSLIIRKVCVLDDNSLRSIIYGCPLLKELVLDMYCESLVTDLSIGLIPNYCDLETLELSHNNQITASALKQMVGRLSKLQSLNLRYSNADDEVVSTSLNCCPFLKSIVLNGCQQITRNSLLSFIETSKAKAFRKLEFIAICSGVDYSSIFARNNCQISSIPMNVEFKVSRGRTRQYLWYESGRFYYSRNPKHL